jgi:hypothetical protein
LSDIDEEAIIADFKQWCRDGKPTAR